MSRTLEITVLSGENLRIDRKPIKKNAYVVVRTDSNNIVTTRMDKEGGNYPSWNEKMVMDMSMHVRFITIEVQCKTVMGIRNIGMARIPVSDFVGGYLPENYLHFLSYRLRDPEGDQNGIVNLSVRVKATEPLEVLSCSRTAAWAGEHGGGSPGVQMSEMKTGNGGGVVTGVPVWWSYPRNY
ncbi:BON1-associated protein 2-like [Quillaja saponaria]|uniref:BON1-associated protein 2-like n=1 Tax=Quillaja saponaria TaxID=32244 RepID=A0AAD7LRY8_QUISA|nr:BON1-associated protein 2-like [Quillaja saponaria]